MQVSALEKQNEKLSIENKKIKGTLHSSVAELQRQMTEALTVALGQKATLETKLKDAEDTIADLQSELDQQVEQEDINQCYTGEQSV